MAMLFRGLVTTGFLLCVVSHARAELTTVAHWPVGDGVADARAGQVVKDVADTGPNKLALTAVGEPVFSDAAGGKAPGSKLSVKLGGNGQLLRRTGLADLKDNFVAEAFARSETDAGFRYVLQYGSGAHGWSVARNGKGYQALLGGVALVGWSGDVPAGEWAHVAIARVDGVTRFYFNGKPAGESNAAPNDAGAAAVFTVGGTNEDKDLFVGEIDDVRVSTFPAGGFDPNMLTVNDPDGSNAARKAAGAPAPAAADTGAAHASIVFDAEPVATNMTFARTSVVPRRVDAANGAKQAWVAQQGSAPDVPWARSVLITLTDPALREGRQPVVDIEVEYRQTFDSPVELRADTATGSRKVGGGWGRNEGWQKFTARIDDAYFGARRHGNKPSDMHTDGYDLRVNSFGTDFAIRSIKVRAYSLSDRPDYKRLIRFDGIASAGDLLLFAPGAAGSIDYKMTNLSADPVTMAYTHETVDRLGRTRGVASGEYALPAQSQRPLSVAVDTAGYERGAYETRLKVTSPDGRVVVERRGGFGVADEAPVARAGPGEFLYGLDVTLGPAYGSPRLLRWAKFMGADIIRHGFGWEDDLDEVAAHLPTYERNGQQVMLMCDPPKTLDEGERARQLKKKVQYLETVAARFPQIKYFELGNEPDLTFFYPGPIERYVEDFHVMSAAIRRGNPDAIVLNGGLCFAGADAVVRAKKFIDLVDPDHLGAWSYHGHGAGREAEASALNRIRDLVRARDKLKPFVDTESGVAAQTPAQEQVQARTVVQKMVYAQQQSAPFLMFFRLLMFEEAYGMLHSQQEPRPAVLSYAALVRELRGHAYQSDLAGLPPAAHGFLFAAPSGPSRAAVLWSDAAGAQQVQLRLDGATGVERVDLYGNRGAVTLQTGGAFQVEVGPDPLYLKWTGTPASGLAVVPNAIGTASEVAVRPEGQDVVPVTITGHDGQPVTGTLRLAAGDAAGLTFPQDTVAVDVAGGESKTLRVPVRVLKQDAAAIDWPRQWTVFVGPDLTATDPTKLRAIPRSLPKRGGGTSEARTVVLRDDRIDFEALGGTMREREPALVMANVRADADQSVTVGASADWWMEWSVNGRVVYSTLDRGNGGGYTISDHTFPLPLTKGDNLVTVRALSGSMGWKLLIGSPSRIAERNADPSLRGLRLDLDQPGKPLQSRTVPVRRVPPLHAWAPADDGMTAGTWDGTQPDFVLLEHVVNAYAAQPDSTKWWKGADDLSARGWLRAKGGELIVTMAVTDDVFRPAAGGADAEQGDAVRLTWVDDGDRETRLDVLPSDGGTATCVVAGGGPAGASARFDRAGAVSFYQVRIPRGAAKPAYLNVTLFDQDGVPAKQKMTLAPASPVPLEGWRRLIWPD